MPLCRFSYQVFVDNVNLKKVAQGIDPGPGQFTWSGAAPNVTMRIGSDPTGKTVEVSTRTHWINATSGSDSVPNNVTIRGLTFRHSTHGGGGIGNIPANGWIIEQNDIGWAHSPGINLHGSSNVVQNNDIHHNSNLGIAGNVQNSTIASNTIHDNNPEGFNFGWAAGGLKITLSKTTTISNNTVYNNTGLGLICDIACNGVTFANNRVYNNTWGLMYEISSNGVIKDNVVFDNAGPNILVWNSDNTTVSGNVSVRGLFAQIELLQANRNTSQFTFPDTMNNVIQNNTLIGDARNAAEQQNMKVLYTGGTNLLTTNTIDSNKLFRYGATPTLYYWINQGYNTSASLCGATGGAAGGGMECNSTVLTQAQADQILATNNIPLTRWW